MERVVFSRRTASLYVLIALTIVVGVARRTAWERVSQADAQPVEVTGVTVTRVVDGYSIEVSPRVQDTEDVRLVGVNTPQTVAPGVPVDPAGRRPPLSRRSASKVSRLALSSTRRRQIATIAHQEQVETEGVGLWEPAGPCASSAPSPSQLPPARRTRLQNRRLLVKSGLPSESGIISWRPVVLWSRLTRP